MATIDTTITHIMDEQDDIKIKSSKCWNPIRPPATLLTSNGYRICIRPPFSAHEYLMESSRSPLSNRSGLISRLHLVWPQIQKQGIGLICTGKINNPRRGVSIAKAQHNVSYGCSRIVNVFPQIVVISTHRKIGPTTALSDEWNSGFINLYIMEGCYRIVLHIDY
uniref:Retrotransposon, putative, centromere-specific n=1 Tax=Oryza sativa subsp. japonica TaxID=39947 RepID=Q10HK3_ORYSJ|nr:retrotransposon, putative, centromere-specific [Oryza sativa Japonica Group]